MNPEEAKSFAETLKQGLLGRRRGKHRPEMNFQEREEAREKDRQMALNDPFGGGIKIIPESREKPADAQRRAKRAAQRVRAQKRLQRRRQKHGRQTR